MNSLGLKSITERLINVEKKIERKVSFPDDQLRFEDVIMTKIKNSPEEIKKKKLSKVTEHFYDGLNSQVNIRDSSNLIKIILYSIKWIESNIEIVAKILNVDVTSEFKLETCIDLVKDVCGLFDNTLIINSINTMVEIIFPKPIKLEHRKSFSFRR